MILLTWFYNSRKQDGAEAQIIREVSLRVFSTGIPAAWNAGKGQCMFEKKMNYWTNKTSDGQMSVLPFPAETFNCLI